MPKGKSKTSSTKPVKEPRSDEVQIGSEEYTFVVPGRPVPKGRPRMTRRGRVYTPKESILAEVLIAESIGEKAPNFTGPVSVEMIFSKESTTVTVRPLDEDAVTGLRGDLDNYIKLLLDGKQRSPLIDNDRQVLHIDAVKI